MSLTHYGITGGGQSSAEPDYFDEDEVAAYAEEYELMQELQDLPVDDIFSLSDFEDGGPSAMDEDVDMD